MVIVWDHVIICPTLISGENYGNDLDRTEIVNPFTMTNPKTTHSLHLGHHNLELPKGILGRLVGNHPNWNLARVTEITPHWFCKKWHRIVLMDMALSSHLISPSPTSKNITGISSLHFLPRIFTKRRFRNEEVIPFWGHRLLPSFII